MIHNRTQVEREMRAIVEEENAKIDAGVYECASCGFEVGLINRASCSSCGYIPPENRYSVDAESVEQ